MSTFESRFSGRAGDIYSLFGESATYQSDSGVFIANVTVLLEFNLNEYSDAGIDIIGKAAVLRVRKSEVDPRPFRDYRFAVGAVTYQVDEVFSSDGLEHQMLVVE